MEMTKQDERREFLTGNAAGLNERARMNPGDAAPPSSSSAGQ
jgi:hypothetical protein